MAKAEKKKVRSMFWIATTHALTAAICMPMVAGAIGGTLMSLIFPSNLTAADAGLWPFIIKILFVGAGWIGGTYYSIGYIRKVSILRDPQACIQPCIIAGGTFIAMAVAFSWLAHSMDSDALALLSLFSGLLGLDFSVGIVPVIAIGAHLIYFGIYAYITNEAFSNMRPERGTQEI